MHVEIAISRSEHERPAELKRILPEFVLAVPFLFGPRPRGRIEGEEELPQSPFPKPGRAIRLALLVDQEREGDSGFRAERGRVFAAAETDGGDSGTGGFDLTLMVAQPGDVLAAEHSAVVAQERDDGRTRFPERAQANQRSGVIRKLYGSELFRDRRGHTPSLARKLRHPRVSRSY